MIDIWAINQWRGESLCLDRSRTWSRSCFSGITTPRRRRWSQHRRWCNHGHHGRRHLSDTVGCPFAPSPSTPTPPQVCLVDRWRFVVVIFVFLDICGHDVFVNTDTTMSPSTSVTGLTTPLRPTSAAAYTRSARASLTPLMPLVDRLPPQPSKAYR